MVIKLAFSKKIIMILVVFLIIASIIGCFTFSVQNKVNTAKNVYNNVSHTFKSLYQKFSSTVSQFKSMKSGSYTLDICLDDVASVPCTGVSLSNNSSDKYFEVMFKNLKIPGKSTIDLSTFATNDKVGFYLDNSPEFYYTAKGEKFRTDWNKSIYGKILKIPEYVPENINYGKMDSLISFENFCKAFVGMGLGKEKINLKDFISNLNISGLKEFTATRRGIEYNAQIAHITVTKDYMESLVQKLVNSSQKAEFDYLHKFLSSAHNGIANCTEKTFKIDLVIHNNNLLWAETSVNLSQGIVNARIDFYDNEVNFELRNLYPEKLAYKNFSFNLKTTPTSLKLSVLKAKSNVFSVILKKQSDSSVISQIEYTDKKLNPHTVNALYSLNSKKYKKNVPVKNIYRLSVSDLLKLYQKLYGSDKNLFSAAISAENRFYVNK